VEAVGEGHTTNPVPVLLAGAGREEVAAGVRDIAGVVPAIVRMLGLER